MLRKRDFKELETKEFEKDNTGFGAIKKVKEFREKYDKEVTYDDEKKESEDTRKKIKAITDQQILEFDNKELKHNLIQSSFWMTASDQSRLTDLKNA